MRRFIAVLALLGGCSAPTARVSSSATAPAPSTMATAAPAASPAGPDATPSCVDDGEPFAEAALRDRVAALARDELGGRAAGSPGDAAGRALIEDRFRCLGLTPGGTDGSYQQPFVDGEGHATANVVGYLPGSDPAVAAEVIVVGAHHDHLGVVKGKTYPGANDNASGVAALLAIAQAARQRDPAPRRTLAFVAFGAEETPGELAGSSFYVAHAPAALAMEQVVYMINLDMVGSYASHQVVAALGSYRKTPGRAVLADGAHDRPHLRVSLGGYGCCSDHLPFCALGIPYVFFWTPDDRCYHESCDTIDNVDVKHMAEITRVAANLATGLADSDEDLVAARAQLGCGQKR